MYNSDIPSRAELPTSRQLVRSTIIAAAVAVALLFTTVLPAEYGIDPTGVGRLTGLTEMGEIKIQLEEEAEADRQRSSSAADGPQSGSNLVDRVFALVLIRSAAAHDGGHGGPMGAQTRDDGEARVESARQADGRKDETSFTLDPGQGLEVKLVMKKGAKAIYAWKAEGGNVNYDKHGDGPDGASKRYKRGRSVSGDEGVLEAAFTGNHGWFWRNRTRNKVTVKLWTNGDYSDIALMK